VALTFDLLTETFSGQLETFITRTLEPRSGDKNWTELKWIFECWTHVFQWNSSTGVSELQFLLSGRPSWNTRIQNSSPVQFSSVFTCPTLESGWLGSRVVSVLTQAQKAWVQIAVATLSGNSLRQTAHTHRASVHQAAKLVAVLLRVARVIAGMAESNGSLPPSLWTCRLTANDRDPLRNHPLGNRVWATFTFLH